MDRQPASLKTFERCPECDYKLPNHSYNCTIRKAIGRRSFLKLVVPSLAVGALLAGVPTYLIEKAEAIPAPTIPTVIEPGSMQQFVDYVIYADGTTVLGKNAKTGANDVSNGSGTITVNAQNTLSQVMTNIGAGGGIVLIKGMNAMGASSTLNSNIIVITDETTINWNFAYSAGSAVMQWLGGDWAFTGDSGTQPGLIQLNNQAVGQYGLAAYRKSAGGGALYAENTNVNVGSGAVIDVAERIEIFNQNANNILRGAIGLSIDDHVGTNASGTNNVGIEYVSDKAAGTALKASNTQQASPNGTFIGLYTADNQQSGETLNRNVQMDKYQDGIASEIRDLQRSVNSVLQFGKNSSGGFIQFNDTTGAQKGKFEGSGKITTYSGQFTAGQGVPPIFAATSQKAETGADASLLSFTPPAVAGSYRLRIVLSISAANAAVIGWTATWKDSNANAQAPANLALFQSGTALPALTFTTSVAGNYYADIQIDIDGSATAIVIKITFSGTSVTLKATATIEQIV